MQLRYWRKSVRKGYRLIEMHPEMRAYDRTKSKVYWTSDICSHSLEFALEREKFWMKVQSRFMILVSCNSCTIAYRHIQTKITQYFEVNAHTTFQAAQHHINDERVWEKKHTKIGKQEKKMNALKIVLRDNSTQHRLRATLFHYDSHYTYKRGKRYARESVSCLFVYGTLLKEFREPRIECNETNLEYFDLFSE